MLDRFKKKSSEEKLPIDEYYTMVERTVPIDYDDEAPSGRKEITIYAIRITREKFKDVIYHYGGVQFNPTEETNEDDEEPQMKMEFTYNVLENPNEEDTNSDEFVTLIGDIAMQILEQEQDKVEYL